MNFSGIGPVITKKTRNPKDMQKRIYPPMISPPIMHNPNTHQFSSQGPPPSIQAQQQQQQQPQAPTDIVINPQIVATAAAAANIQQQTQLKLKPDTANVPLNPNIQKIIADQSIKPNDTTASLAYAMPKKPFIVENSANINSQNPNLLNDKKVVAAFAKQLPPQSMMASAIMPTLNTTTNFNIGSTNGTFNPTSEGSIKFPSSTDSAQQKLSEISKPSEIQTLSLKIGSQKFTNYKISTKIHFGKKQFVWELSDLQSPSKTDHDDSKSTYKKKIEVRFAEITKIDIYPDNNTMTLCTLEKPKEYKEHNPQPKKTTQWIKEGGLDDQMTLDDLKGGPTEIIVTFPKDILTKATPGKPSHLEKIKKCELPLFINGRPYISSNSNTPFRSHSGSFQQDAPTVQNISIPGAGMIVAPEKEISQVAPSNINFRGSTGSRVFNAEIPSLATPGQTEKIYDEVNADMGNMDEEEDEKEFPPLTKEKKIEIKKFESQLKNMKTEDKISLIMDTIKPKRHNINTANKKFYKCPVYKCNYPPKSNLGSLKTHIQNKHKKLVELGFDLDQTGNFKWSTELLDFCLMVSKIYPRFVKNIIKEAKKNKNSSV